MPGRAAPRTYPSSELPHRRPRATRNWSLHFRLKAQLALSEISMRSAEIERNTKETQIQGRLELDGQGQYEISTGIRFFDHMLELFTKHGGFDLKLKATGDLDVDQHHTAE